MQLCNHSLTETVAPVRVACALIDRILFMLKNIMERQSGRSKTPLSESRPLTLSDEEAIGAKMPTGLAPGLAGATTVPANACSSVSRCANQFGIRRHFAILRTALLCVLRHLSWPSALCRSNVHIDSEPGIVYWSCLCCCFLPSRPGNDGRCRSGRQHFDGTPAD